jgi:hypothetical protein
VKRPGDKWLLRDHVAFYSYRWAAWILAALALTLPSSSGATLPRDAGILLLVAVITVIATALAQGYVRVLRQRPALLTLDLAACAAVLWLGGSSALPFMPYALGALVLPALVFGWRGALPAASAFAALDMFGLTVVSPATGAGLSAPALAARIIIPFAFAAAWAAVSRLIPRESDPVGRGVAGRSSGSPLAAGPGGDLARRHGAPLRVAPLTPPDAPAGRATNLAALAPLQIARPAAEPEPRRRVLYDLPAPPQISLGAALEQLAASAARQGGLSIRSVTTGEARPLNASQQTLLLKTAQEALLNIRQHAHARSALLTLSFEPQAVTLLVKDDGVGLLDGTYERPGLHALRALRYRIAEHDGQLAVFEGESGGLTVQVTLPLE